MRKSINIKKLWFKPYTKFNPIEIMGEGYFETIISPKVYILETEDVLVNDQNIEFRIDDIIYYLDGILVTKKEGKYIIECRYWKETYIDKEVIL